MPTQPTQSEDDPVVLTLPGEKHPPYQPGQSGNPAGRPKGVQNKKTVAGREFWERELTRPKYLAALRKRLIEGNAQNLERLGNLYRFGRPPYTHNVVMDPVPFVVAGVADLADLKAKRQAVGATDPEPGDLAHGPGAGGGE